MKVYRFSIMLVFITMTALLYVHQQVQLIKVGYKIETGEKELASTLDQNKDLIYNITKLKSPVNLENKFLSDKTEYNVTRQCRVVRLYVPKTGGEAAVQLAKAKKENMYIAFFKKLGRPKEVFANTLR